MDGPWITVRASTESDGTRVAHLECRRLDGTLDVIATGRGDQESDAFVDLRRKMPALAEGEYVIRAPFLASPIKATLVGEIFHYEEQLRGAHASPFFTPGLEWQSASEGKSSA